MKSIFGKEKFTIEFKLKFSKFYNFHFLVEKSWLSKFIKALVVVWSVMWNEFITNAILLMIFSSILIINLWYKEMMLYNVRYSISKHTSLQLWNFIFQICLNIIVWWVGKSCIIILVGNSWSITWVGNSCSIIWVCNYCSIIWVGNCYNII